MAVYNFRGYSPAGFVATANVTKDTLVKQGTADGECTPSSAITDVHLGVALETVSAGGNVPVQQLGKAKVKAVGAVTRGDRLMWATGGVATLSGSTAKVCGTATMSSADGEYVEFEAQFPALHDTQ